MAKVLASGFDFLEPVEQVLEQYCLAMPKIVLAYAGDKLAAFHFFDQLRVQGIPVFRLSLAAKSADASRGAHKAMVRGLLLDSAWRLNPFRPLALVGVCNSPRTYCNAMSAGGQAFPEVSNPSRRFPYRDLYRQVARRLAIEGLDPETGVIKNRAASVGLIMKPASPGHGGDPRYQDFLNYVRGDLNLGVLTMVVIRPLRLALNSLGARARRAIGLQRH